MDKDHITKTLIEILRKVQEDAGYAPVEITETTRPVDELEGFDSKVWPVSITLLSKALGIDIPKKTRLYEDGSGTPLTIAEIVERIWKVVKLQSPAMQAEPA